LFAFFTTEARAQRHQDQSTMEGRWELTNSDSEDVLIKLCEEQSARYDAFIFDPIAIEGTVGQPVTLAETKSIFADNIGASEWELGY
jgi:hypothetical protein